MKIIVCHLLLIFTLISGYSQKSLNEYYFVHVPRQFDFQTSKDQFRLNTLLRHLFNTNGFNAIYDEEMGDLPRCEGIYSDVIQEKTIFTTKLYIVIKDCFNNEILRSEVGQSKEKDLTQSYPEALLKSFESIKRRNIQQQDLAALRQKSSDRLTTETTEIKNQSTTQTINQLQKSSDLAVYQFENTYYFLEKKSADFILYKNQPGTEQATQVGYLRSTSRSGIYLYESQGNSYLAHFDDNKNLIIDAPDATGALVPHVYQWIEE